MILNLSKNHDFNQFVTAWPEPTPTDQTAPDVIGQERAGDLFSFFASNFKLSSDRWITRTPRPAL